MMHSFWRLLKKLCDAIKAKIREAEGHAREHQHADTDDVKRSQHLFEVRKRRINKLENMRKAAALDQDENLEEYTEQRLAQLKRLQQEAELVKLGQRSSSRESSKR